MNYEAKLTELTQLKDKMNQYRPLPPTEVKQLEKNIRIEHVWSSAAIEGNTFNKYETAAIINSGLGATIHGKTIRETLEIIDLNEAYGYMQELATEKRPLQTIDIRNLNRIATLETLQSKDEAGKYRQIDVYPYSLEDHPYLAPYDIPQAMDNLIQWSNQASETLHPVQYATDLHQKFVSIHPFRDGNGRTARLLMNFALTKNGYPVINVNPSKEARNKYMEALETSRSDKNMSPFRNLIADYVKSELNRRTDTLELGEENEKEAQKDFAKSKLDWDKLFREYKAQKDGEIDR
ncbi:Fic family protein [Bombilactobacillus folatiphilus]|uniref:Fic family protein n=1 Tax=Bombilactobacillus folatiphilus TaxID=2923362 RepID=A0ABY4P8V7_9LACO|nr:Fic family protein [Bombilactobacillus folatiphilus]UQS82173.1 Fic family protein [Bombilactobacillus folatiphilus]